MSNLLDWIDMSKDVSVDDKFISDHSENTLVNQFILYKRYGVMEEVNIVNSLTIFNQLSWHTLQQT